MKRGFTLTELLVAMAVIILLLILSIPAFKAMRGDMLAAGVNTINAACEATRKYAARDMSFLKKLEPDGLHGQYSGTAMIFDTNREIRIVENYQQAQHGTDYLEVMTPPRNGFTDIKDRSYIAIPSGVGVLGAYRDTELKMIAPPFAIRFDDNGHLIDGTADQIDIDTNEDGTADAVQNVYMKVIYDGNYDGNYDITSNRPFDHEYPMGNARFNSTENKYELPFERFEAVIAVVVFDLDEVLAKLGDDSLDATTDGAIPDNTRDFIVDMLIPIGDRTDSLRQRLGGLQARIIWFNRYTGVPLRNK